MVLGDLRDGYLALLSHVRPTKEFLHPFPLSRLFHASLSLANHTDSFPPNKPTASLRPIRAPSSFRPHGTPLGHPTPSPFLS